MEVVGVAVVAAILVVALAVVFTTSRSEAGPRRLADHRDAIGDRLDVMAGELARVLDLVGVMQRERSIQHGQLLEGLRETMRTTGELASTTHALQRALANPKARGQWGERMADDVLRAAGLQEGISYRKQRALQGGTIPDITFLLPRDLLLHMDVKFPIDNYLRHLEATTDGERSATGTAFLRDVRTRVRELAHRGYADPATTPGFMLLFIPNESVYSFIQEHDPGVGDLALAQHVVLCSPFTLFAVLGVIRHAVDCFALERAADEILTALSRFNDQWTRFSEHLDRLGKQLTTAHATYDEVAGVRRRQLEKRLDEIEALRASRSLVPCEDSDETPHLREVNGP